jgi:hypothetical protein
MVSKSGGPPLRIVSGGKGKKKKETHRTVKSGYDQEFTLPKGTSAAPIKQVAKKVKKIIGSVPHEVSIQLPAWGALMGHLTRKDKSKKEKYNPRSKILVPNKSKKNRP